MNATLISILALASLLVLVPIVSVQLPRFRAIKAREAERAQAKTGESVQAKTEPKAQAKTEEKNAEAETRRSYTRILWTSLAAVGGLLLLSAYAILIAYCLAWFIVYQTEARLHETRRGLIQGGDMRLCLCSRG